MRCGPALLAVAMTFALAACSQPTTSSTAPTSTAKPSIVPTAIPSPVATTLPAQPRLASDAAQLADDLVADEQALRDPSSSESVLTEAARRQQVAYRTLGRNPEAEAIARPRIPPQLLDIYDYNIDARHQLDALLGGDLGHPARVAHRRPCAGRRAARLLPRSRKRDRCRLELPGGDQPDRIPVRPHCRPELRRCAGPDAVHALDVRCIRRRWRHPLAARQHHGGRSHPRRQRLRAETRTSALYRYNNSDFYVQAVKDYAAVFATDPSAFGGYYRWDVYYHTTAGDVLLPIGYVATSPIPVADYLATHPQ